jgi:hypothetical protein
MDKVQKLRVQIVIHHRQNHLEATSLFLSAGSLAKILRAFLTSLRLKYDLLILSSFDLIARVILKIGEERSV